MGTRIRTHITPKMRIISFVLAFVMVFVGLPYIGNNMKVKATTGSAIEPTSTTSSIKINGQSDGDGYIYTGKIKPITVDLFDYKTDREINVVTDPLQDGAYTYYNRYNPYHLFDTAISNNMGSLGNTTLPASENITIVYKSLRFTNNDSVRVHLWNDSNATTWPGLEMNYDSQDGNGFYIFSLTFNVGFLPDHLIFSNNGSDLYKTLDISQSMQKGHKYTFEDKYDANGHTGLIFRTGSISDATVRIHLWKDSDPPWDWNNRPALGRATNSSPYYYPIPNLEAIKCNDGTIVDLGVLPKHFIINSNGNKDFGFTIEKGYTYIFTSAGDLVSDQYPTKYPTDVSCTDDEANASVDIPVPQSKLYLGNFLARISNDPINSPHNNNKDANNNPILDNTNVTTEYGFGNTDHFNNDPANYNTTGASKGHMSPSTTGGNLDSSTYDAFYWQANISQRPEVDFGPAEKPKAAIQGLVDQTLTNGIVSQNGIPLPYFNPSGPTASYMTVYQSTPSSTISFPFYEVLKNADGAEGYVPGTYSGTEKARYYEFSSKDAHLIFDTSERKFKETDTQIQAATGTVGYFPFNSNNSPYTDNSGTGASGKGLNYGFGTKFEMTFKLKKDGMVPAVTDQGKTIKDEQNPSKVATYFEFEGDDDLWVFIDGNLVLDMGGSHAESKGYINFKNKTATVTNAVQYGVGGVDNVGLLGTEKTIDITSKINKSTTNDGGYDEDEIHTMTIFYMERGMAESNLLIRYNFPSEPNFHKMKVREETDFSNVNEGLKDLTMIAAETDVFKYKIENNGTKNEDVLQINAPYPTTDNYIRQVADDAAPTKLTSSSPAATPTSYSFQPGVTVDGNWHDVKNVSYEWVDEYAKESSTGDKMNSNVHASGRTTSESNGGYMYLMYGTPAGGGAERVKSSGEFEGQFARYSLMRVTQQEDLYTPSTHVTTGAAATLNTDKYVDSDSNPAPRFFSTYYNLKKNYIFSTLNKEELGNYYLLNENGQAFKFRNNIVATPNESGGYTYLVGDSTSNKDANEKTSVVMTVQFVNEPKVGAITITKVNPTGDTGDNAIPTDKDFTIKVRFEDIFGIDDVDADDEDDYTGIKYKVYSGGTATQKTMGSDTVKVSGSDVEKACGTITLRVGQTATIEGIPVGTKYYIYEEEQKYAPKIANTNNNDDYTVQVGEIQGTNPPKSKTETTPSTYTDNNNNVTVTNFSHTLTIKEVTDFSTVNGGLLTYTKKAAENDVFKYTVSNQNTSDGDVVDSGIKTPTYDQYKRINNGETTTLTYHAPVPDTTHIYLDTSKKLNTDNDDTWSYPNAQVAAYIYNSGSGGHTVLGEYISENLYRFDIQGYSKVYFKRFSPGTTVEIPNNSDITADWGNQTGCRITFQAGATYKVDSWSQTKLETSTPVKLYPTETHNYTPSVSNTTVSNTNYEWTDELAAPSNTFTNTTGNDGGLYLMHGEDSNNTNSSTTHISSATFYNQFKRDNNSIMTVEQVNTLYSPDRTQTPDALGSTGQRTSNTLGTYYTMSKSLSGSQTAFSPADSNSFVYNDLNANKSVRITETFTNQVNVGSLKITKVLSPNEDDTNNTAKSTAEFKFRIKLTNVFGVGSNNVAGTGYSSIDTKKGTSSLSTGNHINNSTGDYGEFYLKIGETLEIDNIPVGTAYELWEEEQSTGTYYELNEYQQIVSGSHTSLGTGHITGSIDTSGVTKEYQALNKRKTGTLTVSKSLIGDDNNTNVNSNTTFHFKVQLTKPTGVTFKSGSNAYYPITCTNSDNTTATYDYDDDYVIVTAKKDGTATISGIPYGTEYTVTEVADSAGNPISNDTNYPNVVYDNKQSGTINSPSTVSTTVKNIYRKITLTKEDSKDNDKKLNGAEYYLLKLNDAFDTAYTANPTAVENTFKSAEHCNDTSLTPYYSGYSGTLTTADLNGFSLNDTVSITLNDSNVTHGITAGKYFLFEETAPNNNYERDNSFTYTDSNNQTHSKIITVGETETGEPTYSVTYGDPRKTGNIVINKELFAGTDATTYGNTAFTFNVELDGTNGDGTGVDLDLSKYGITEKINNVSSATTLSYNSSTHKYTGTITVTKNAPVTIENIPYGTSYSISEAPTGQWKKISEIGTPALSGTINVDLPDVGNIDTATITTTNALTGTLQLSKALTGDYNANGKNTTDSFYFDVTLITPDDISQSTLNSIVSGATFTQDATNTRKFTSTVSVQGNSTPVSISGLPYGTTYSVVEADESQNKTQSITYALNSTAGTITNKTISAANVVTTTNNYPELGSLVISKTATGDGRPVDQPFTFTVTLTPQSGTFIDLEDFDFTYDGTKATLSDDHKSFTVTLKGGESLNISGIPVGTGYSVAESTPPSGWELTSQTGASGTISTTLSEADFTNTYTEPTPTTASLTITKTDTNGTAITSSPATYYLLKLNAAFDTAYADNPATLSNTFKNAASVAALSTYGTAYGPKQTDSNGRVVFTDSDLTIATGDKFFFYEAQAPYGYAIDNSLTYVDSSGNTHSKILSVTAADTNPTAVYPNPNTTGVSVYKTNEYGEGLENGEFDLYYKQETTTTSPPTYSYNKPETPPVPEATTKINRNNLTVPDDAAGTSQVTTYTYKYSYPSKPSMPSSTEEDWILPRSDNDYIYFRDYNTGTVNSKDTEAFFYQDYENNQKRYWINTWLTNNDYGQNEEIGYDHRYKIKAQFTKNGSDLKEYEAWERFVDEYTDTANNSSYTKRKTVVWKIQPPDGYNKVRFCLYDGGQCIRTTQEFSFVLGNIYTKTGQGDGTDHKWNYPVKGEHWSTNWNGTGAGQSDKRMNYSSIYQSSGTGWENTTNYVYNNQSTTSSQQAPEQTQRYTATEQKIVFQCNSKQVWHNIHIEFFSSANENDRIGHGFPGYMMEPYAFAGNDYRMKGYLTYELTIPKGATHFRINNGVSSGSFAYKTPITQLCTDTSKNNYGNFFKFDNTPQNKPFDSATLRQWTKQEIQNAGDKYYATYNTADVESDYDYIYFKLPSGSGWSSHVYAYFYGGGDLRAHNWQRGVYSIWPGVAPVATEYSVSNGGTDTAQHSDHYTYEYTQTLFSELPTNAGNLTGINPESTFTYNGDTVYKFRRPKSERVTYENNGKRVYDKVIFNDGSSRYSNGQETGMIGFKAGYIYSPDDTTGKKYYGDATSNYTGRGDYLYINNAANWDNLHVTFYNANGTAIWQGGTGYIMQYEGTKDGKKYYRIPIPSKAAKFKLNNGKGGASTNEFGVIYPKQNAVDTSKKDYTTGDMIYTLNANKSLTKDYPNFTAPTQVPHTSESATLQARDVDYITRGDKLYIRNTAEWSDMDIGAVKVKFYDSSNNVIGTTGTYTMIVSETESTSQASDNRTNGAGSSTATKWYSIDIPMNAAKFELTAPHATATKYDIYELINSDGSTERSYKWTKGDMYYETSGTNALTLLYPTYYQSVDYTATDTYMSARGDNLYLVVSNLDKWENMRVTFYDGNGTAIKNTANDTAIVPNYIGYKSSSPTNSEAAGYWFRIAIPTGAESFRATGSASNSDSGDIYELSQNRTYHFRNDYTPGDMQYRITDTLSGGTYNLSLMYPIFTEEPFYSLNDEVNNSYPTNNITIPTPTSGTNDAPVLYETSSNNITYNWTESTADGKLRFDKINVSSWSTIKAQFYNGTSKVGSNTSMTHESGNIYKIDVPTQTYTKVVISSGDYSTTVDGSDFANKKIVARTPVVQQSSRKYLFWVPNTNANNNQFCWFYDSEDNHISSYVGEKVGPDNNEDYYLRWDNVNNVISSSQLPRIDKNDGSYNSINVRKVKIPPGAVKVKFACGFNTSGDDGVLYETSEITISTIEAGRGLYANSISVENGHHWGTATPQPFSLSSAGLEDGSTVITCDVYDYTSGSLSSKSATYQPEDRYGMISNLNSSTTPVTSGFNDDGNFIKVVLASGTTITKPYIKFLDSSNTVIDKPISLTARLNGSTSDANAGVAQPGDGSSNNPYKIRLPKNAKSVELYDDSTKIGNTITLTNDGGATLTVSGTGDSRTVSKTSTTKNSTALQSGVTADEGFIFYKGTMTHAYYYGGVDGEFCAWPGVPYSYTYTDGSDTVYAFQIPTTSNSTSKVYPYVIFNDGTNNSGTNMTVAVDYTGKEIYQDSNASGAYGSWSAAPKTVTHTTKTTPTPQGDPDDTPPEYTEIHLATIVTGADGKQKYIKWLKPKPGAEDEVDTEYLDHVFSDIGKDANKKEVRVKKLGEYYWVETVAPAGYKAVKDKIEFTLTQADTAAGSYITHIVDEPLPGKVLLMKTAKEKVGNTDIGDPLPGAGFNLTTRAVQTTFISVAKKTNKSEYYVIPTDDEEYVALSRSGEYDTDGTVSKTIPDSANPGATTSVTVAKLKEYTELFTDENGCIKIENLVWGDYVLTETNNTPSGYAGSLSKVYFTVGKNNSDITQELSLKDEMNPAYIKLFEHINERRNAWGDPTFTFKIKQTHEYVHTYNNGTWTDTLTEIPDYLQKEILVSLTVNDDGTLNSNILRSDFNYWLVESTDEVENTKLEYQGMYHIDSQGRIRVEPGSYEITRMPVSRYEFVTSAYTNQYNNGGTAGSQNENLDSNSKPLEKVTISGLAAGKTIDVHYYDKVGYYDKFSQVDTKINKFYTLDSDKNNTTVKGIRVDDYYVDTANGNGTLTSDTLTVNNFKAYKIMADGTEQQITDSTELAKLAITYTYDSSSKDDEQFADVFSYSNSTITVGNVSRYHDSVYKLNVSYTDDTFTTTAAFNLVFEKQSTNVTYYTAQVIFKNDSQDTTSHDPSNISYFEEDNNRTHAYEFTFVIADDNGTKTVSDIRHNGTSIGTGDTAWTSAISDMNNNHFKILDSYSTYNFASWVQLAPSSPNLTDYNSIVGYITGLTPTDGKADSIEFAAHLTSS